MTTLLQVANDNVSLSAVIDEEHEFHLSDKLEQDTIPAADFVFLRQSLRRHVQQALGELVEKEEMVLRLAVRARRIRPENASRRSAS